ncbi:unnamed protein product [Cuscuta europaea]|uniref:RNase H type-1 domain-containing protein n=1 Tax=Cuscuta europaea TaxID=41803 RepID=A0A9P0ZDK7_CUSEU|nr:unnamed protein product [Cuscuta europaea]
MVAAATLVSWRSAQEVGSRSGAINDSHTLITWQKPEQGWVKINVDAANHNTTGRWAWGWIARDREGAFLRACSRVVKDSWSTEAEAIGVREVIIWAREAGWSKTVIETDAALVLSGINGEISASYVGIIFEDIKYLVIKDNNVRIQRIRGSCIS